MKTRLFRAIAWGAGALFMLLVVLLGGAGLFLQTDSGRGFLTRQVSDLVSEEDGLTLELSGLRGNIFGQFSVERIALSDPAGLWAEAGNLSARWSPVSLLAGRLNVEYLGAETLNVWRQPDLPAAEVETDAPSGGPVFPLPIKIRLSGLDVKTLTLGETLLGRAAILSVFATLNSRQDGSLQSTVRVVHLDGQEGEIAGIAEFWPGSQELAIDFQLMEPPGGLLGRALALPGNPALSASLVGAGTLNDWQGQVLARAEGLIEADLLLLSGPKPSLDLVISGGVRIAEALSGPIPFLDDRRVTLDAVLALEDDNDLLVVDSLSVENPVLHLTGGGRLGLGSGTTDSRLNLAFKDLTELQHLMGPASLQALSGTVQAAGALEDLTVQATVLADGVVVDGGPAIPALKLTATADYPGTAASSIPVSLSLSAAGVTGLPAPLQDLLGADIDLSGAGVFDPETSLLDVGGLTVNTAHAALSAEGQFSARDFTLASNLTLTIDDLGVVAPIAGTTRLLARIDSPDVRNRIAADLTLQAEGLDTGVPGLGPVVGKAPLLKARANWSAEGLALSNTVLEFPSGKVSMEGKIPATFDRIAAQLEGNFPALAPLTDLVGMPLSGSGRVTAEITGPLADPDLAGRIALQGVSLSDQKVGNVDVTVQAAHTGTSPAGRVALSVEGGPVPLTASSDIAVPDFSRLDARTIEVQQGENRITGGLSVPFDGSPPQGQFEGALSDWRALAALTGQDLSGSLTARALIEDRSGIMALRLSAEGKDVRQGPETGLETITLVAALGGDMADPDLEFDLRAGGAEAGTFRLDRIEASGAGRLSALDLRFDLQRPEAPSLSLSGAGQLALKEQGVSVLMSRLEGALGDRQVQLLAPLQVQQSAAGLSVLPFSLGLGDGTVGLEADLGGANSRAALSLTAVPVDLVTVFQPDFPVSGRLDGTAEIGMEQGRGAGTFRFDATGIRIEDADLADLPPIEARLEGSLAAGRLATSARISGIEASGLSAEATLPVALTLSPFSFDMDGGAPISGRFDAVSDLGRLIPLLGLDTHSASGRLQAEGQMSGTMDQPLFDGQGSLSDGRYENMETGTILEALSLQGEVRQSDQVAFRLSASDGRAGTVNGNGTLRLTDLGRPALDIVVALENFMAADRDDVAIVTDADIAVNGQLPDLATRGTVTTRTVEINIGGSLAPQITELEVTEINRPGASDAGREPDAKQAGTRIALDLGISLPQRVFIRGRGLESEWAGDFTVKGTAAAPLVEGSLRPVRGQFSFAGKDFKLDKGAITLIGGKEINPELDLSAIYEARDVTAVVSITGTASAPEISFSSPDGLPEDEVLSHVLFGKSAGKLSAVEALQLANAVATVSGTTGAGGGLMGFARDALGVDVLTAGTDEETGKAEVSVGKYINDNIYVGVDQGTEAGSTRARVEIELTPNITVESETSQSSDSSVGVFWKWDY
ncbi:translocation/assembly module TamB domain-containing protein [Sneathiella chinensis]|uniref:Translocation/assembly module TamB n=1 Tax=Sneathiella chinensis TaxID=349750 RepID=A0ABQ5U0A2_9PROT|nr:translocation/assembly module TamB domain-containing protein [Sneathiella chinensis]GLQ05101.1 translocation/assembly module TamB [Sneathiella chinensis]